MTETITPAATAEQARVEREKAARAYCHRSFTLTEIRVSDSEADPVIEGYAAVFDQWTEINGWWPFRERIAKGAFKKTIKENDIRALFNHNPDWVLGRNRAGTLELSEDDHGLKVTIRPPDTSFAKDLLESMRRGDINQMSFGFETIKDNWTFTKNDDELDERTLLEARLWDVSPVTFPAYPQTEAFVRSAIDALQRLARPAEPPVRSEHSAEPRRQDDVGLRREPLKPEHSLADDGSREDPLPAQEAKETPEPSVPAHSLAYYEALLATIEIP